MIPLKLPKEQKQQLVHSLQSYLETELDVEIGQLAGEGLLDHMLRELAPHVYNQALADARKVVEQRMASIEEELYALELPLTMARRR